MFASALFMLMRFAPGQIVPWATCDKFDHFVELLTGAAACYQRSDGVIVQLDERGQKIRETACPRESNALYIDTKGKVIAAPRTGVFDIAAPAKQLRQAGFSMFAQRDWLFVQTSGLTFLGNDSTYSAPEVDYFGGGGINPKGDTLAIFRDEVGSPQLTIVRRHEAGLGVDWNPETFIRTPGSPWSTAFALLNRYNDIRFIGDDEFAFIGQALPPSPSHASEVEKQIAKCPDLVADALPENTKSSEVVLLIVTRVLDGLAVPVAKLNISNSNGEGGSSRTGQMTVSGDGKYLFVREGSEIWRLPISNLLVTAGMKA